MSRKHLSTILLLCFFISACANLAPAPTATATLIPPTPSATPTATATLTPVPTVTLPPPTPALPSAIVADVEASLPGYTLQGTTPLTDVGDQLIDPEGRVVPEMKVIPWKFGPDGDKGWLVKRDYVFDGRSLPTYLRKGEINVMQNGGLDMSALQYIDGQLKPKFAIHTDYASGEETRTNYQLISLPEAIRKVYDPTLRLYNRDGKFNTKLIPSDVARVLGINNGVITLDEIKFPVNNNVPKGGWATALYNSISTVNVETNQVRWAPVLPYYYAPRVEGGKYAYFGFVNDKGEIETYFIDNSGLNVMGAKGKEGTDTPFFIPFTMFIPTGAGY